MEKITFINGQAPAINDYNLNKMQDNMEQALSAEMNEIKYNLITNGAAVKTGRKIDGQDEYVQRFYFDAIDTKDATFTKELDFSLSDVIITSSDGMGCATGTNSWYPLQQRHDNYTGILDSADSCYWLTGTDNCLNVKSYNANLKKAYINIYFIYINAENL